MHAVKTKNAKFSIDKNHHRLSMHYLHKFKIQCTTLLIFVFRTKNNGHVQVVYYLIICRYMNFVISCWSSNGDSWYGRFKELGFCAQLYLLFLESTTIKWSHTSMMQVKRKKSDLIRNESIHMKLNIGTQKRAEIITVRKKRLWLINLKVSYRFLKLFFQYLSTDVLWTTKCHSGKLQSCGFTSLPLISSLICLW